MTFHLILLKRGLFVRWKGRKGRYDITPAPLWEMTKLYTDKWNKRWWLLPVFDYRRIQP